MIKALLNGTTITEFQPQNNVQAYLAYLCGAGNELPKPRTNEEILLYNLCTDGAKLTETGFQPQNRKQAYLGHLAGLLEDTSDLPMPVTKEEVLLYNLCTSGGGTVLLPTTEVKFSYGSAIVEGAYPFVEGKTYVVNWNGKEVRCVAFVSPYAAAGYVSIGNKRVISGDTGEPFLMSSNGVDVLQINPYDGSTTAIVSIHEL